MICGHDQENLVEIDGQPACYVCWVIDSGNYCFNQHGVPTGPEVAHSEVSSLAAKVRQLAARVAEHDVQLQRLLNAAPVVGLVDVPVKDIETIRYHFRPSSMDECLAALRVGAWLVTLPPVDEEAE